MRIKELIQDNEYIGDIKIEFRQNKQYLLKITKIGLSARLPNTPLENIKYEIITKPINKFDIDKETVMVLRKEIPKEILNLEIYDWHSSRAFRDYPNYHELEELLIKVNVKVAPDFEKIEGQQELF